MKNTLLYTSLFLMFALFTINKAAADEIIRMKVKENKATCTGVGPMKCLLVQYKGSKEWTFFYSEIEDFHYEEGFRYTLLVNRKTRNDVPADASIYAYELVKVIKKRKKKVVRKEQTAPLSPVDFLAKHKWTLIQMNGIIHDIPEIYMVFDKEKGQVNGLSGCNRFFGPYHIKGDRISFDQVAGTLMACTPEIGQAEAEFLSLLRKGDLHFDIAEQTLNIYNGKDLILMFGLSPL